MEKQDFIKLYCEKSGITEEELQKTQVVLPCNCNHELCKGWAVISNNELSIKNHYEQQKTKTSND